MLDLGRHGLVFVGAGREQAVDALNDTPPVDCGDELIVMASPCVRATTRQVVVPDTLEVGDPN